MTWKGELDRWLASLESKGRSTNYLANARSALGHLGARFGPASYFDLTRDDFVKWFNELRKGGITGKKGLSDATMNYMAAVVKACLRWLNDGETPKSLRTLGAIGRRRSRIETKEDLLTDTEFRRLVRPMPLDKRVILRLLRATGARPSEVLGLRWRDAKLLEEGGKTYAEVDFRNTKTRTNRTAYVGDPAAVRELKELVERRGGKRDTLLFPSPVHKGEPMQYGSLHGYLKKKAKALGISKRVYPYMFRHMRATELMVENIPRQFANQLMGWKGTMWENYAHLGTNDVRDWVLEHEAGPSGAQSSRETVEDALQGILEKLSSLEGLDVADLELRWSDGASPTKMRARRITEERLAADRRLQDHVRETEEEGSYDL